MRKNKDNIKYIEKKLRNIKSGTKNIIEIAREIGTSREMVGKWYKEFKDKNKLALKIHIPTNAYGDDYNNRI